MHYFINNENGLPTKNDVLIKNKEKILDNTPIDKRPSLNNLLPYNISNERDGMTARPLYQPNCVPWKCVRSLLYEKAPEFFSE